MLCPRIISTVCVPWKHTASCVCVCLLVTAFAQPLGSGSPWWWSHPLFTEQSGRQKKKKKRKSIISMGIIQTPLWMLTRKREVGYLQRMHNRREREPKKEPKKVELREKKRLVHQDGRGKGIKSYEKGKEKKKTKWGDDKEIASHFK